MFNKKYTKRNKTYIIIFFIFSLFISIGYSAVKDNLLVSTGAKFSPVPMVKSTSLDDTRYFRNETYKDKIKTITFEDNINVPNNAITSWDIGVNQNGDVMAYVIPNTTDSTYYDLYIQADGKIYANKDMSSWFRSMNYVERINNIELLDTKYTTNMSNIFTYFGANASSVELDVSSWNTSNVTNMSGMFNNVGSSSPKVTLTLGSINTSKATDMSAMFYKTAYSDSNFTLDISSLDTSNVTDMSSMFRETGYNSTVFTLDVSNFDTRKATNMNSMFKDAGYQSKVITLDVSNFDTSKVTDMSNMFAFTGYYNPSFTLDVSNFDTSNVTTMKNMFRETGYQSTVFTLDLSNFNTSKVTDMSYMFRSSGENSPIFNLNISNFDTSNVTNMENMFYSMANTSTELNFTFTIKNPNTTTYTDMFKSVAINSGTKITVNYTTATSSLVDQMIATKPAVSNVVKGININLPKIGDEKTIAGEQFYVISVSDDTVTLLTKEGLNKNYRQSTSPATVGIANASGWTYTPGPKEIDIQATEGNAKTYINEYVNYLKEQTGDNTITGNLITASELKSLGCTINSDYSNGNSPGCQNSEYKSLLIKNYNWWTRSAYPSNGNAVWFVLSDGTLYYNGYTSSFVIRPTITVSIDTLIA